MKKLTVDQVMVTIRRQLHLSKETETEVLAEIRTHLEDAVANAAAQGIDQQQALREAAERFGIQEAGAQLQELHANRESLDAIIATALPVLLALILRWVAFSPNGTALNWQPLWMRPVLQVVLAVLLLVPFIFLRRSRLALVAWAIFWLLSVMFIFFPSISQW